MSIHALSIAMTTALSDALLRHLDKGPHQEDLTFAVWRPSRGANRETAVLHRLLLPEPDDRILDGNVSFTADYAFRAMSQLEAGEGLALIHGHLGPGWQGMSEDDIVAERDRLAGAAFGRTGLPVVGLTAGTDGSWSGREWIRTAARTYERLWATSVRVVGRRIRLTYHPGLMRPPSSGERQVATISVWGEKHQADLARCRVGIVGLGSVGSLVAECLARVGVSHFVLIDPDRIEARNLDRTAGALREDATDSTAKVEVAERNIRNTATGEALDINAVAGSLLTPVGLAAALDCDVLFSCVDRPWPRHLLNAIAYAHLIPVVDGGIFTLTAEDEFVHADWSIHTVGPERACLVCLGAIDPGDVALDIDGKLDAPDYIQNLGQTGTRLLSRRNVFPFSMSVAAHEVLQFVGSITGLDGVGGIGPQRYRGYPGAMEVRPQQNCTDGCSYFDLTGTAADLSGSLNPTAS